MQDLLKRHPFLFSCCGLLGAVPIMWLFLTPITRLVPFYCGETVKYLGTIFVTLAFSQEAFGGIPCPLRGKGLIRNLFTLGLPGLILAGIFFLFPSVPAVTTPGLLDMVTFPLCLLALAVGEELLFRGLILRALDRLGTRRAVLLSSLLCGLGQLTGLVFGQGELLYTLGQAGIAFFAGLYLAALCLRTGDLSLCILLHFLEALGTGLRSLFAPVSPSGILLMLALHSLLIPAAIFLLKHKKREQIL